MFSDSNLRAKVQNAENKRVYREALKKKLNQINTNEQGEATSEDISLPSFAFVNKLGLIECALC